MTKRVQIISDGQIASAAKSAGFSGGQVAIITAIALAESSGNMYAHNPIPPDNSYGLTQINMLGGMGPERRKRYGLTSNDQLFDPVTNMRAAYDISGQGKNWRPWSTYTNGAYRLYLNRSEKAAGTPAGDVPTAGGTGATQASLSGGIDSFGKAADFLTAWQTWARAGMILGGSILVLVALSVMSGTVSKVGAAVNMATDVIPQTRGIKAAARAVKGAK